MGGCWLRLVLWHRALPPGPCPVGVPQPRCAAVSSPIPCGMQDKFAFFLSFPEWIPPKHYLKSVPLPHSAAG